MWSTSGISESAASIAFSRFELSEMLASGAVLNATWNSPLSWLVMKEDSRVEKIPTPATKEAKARPSTLFLCRSAQAMTFW